VIHWRTRQQVVKVVLAALTLAFLVYQWLPILTMALLSFTGPDGGTTFPMRGVSVYWYRELLRVQSVDDFKPPMLRSLLLALTCSATTAVLAVAAAQAMRARFRGSGAFFYLVLLGVMAPGKCGTTKPPLRPEAPPPTMPASTTATESPAMAAWSAAESPQ